MKLYVRCFTSVVFLFLASCGSSSSLVSISVPSVGTDTETTPDNSNTNPGTGGDGNSSPAVTTCPTHFIKVPANTALGTSDFCLAKFEMKASLNDGTAVFDGNNSGTPLDTSLHKPESRPDGIPWVRITLAQAAAECASLGTGYHLSTLKEWQAAALNIESVASNWSGNSVGSGTIIRGHSDGAISASAVSDGYAVSTTVYLLGAKNATDPFGGTGQTSGNQKRTHTLSNGEIIWDMPGNAREIVDPNGSAAGVNYTGPTTSGFYEVLGGELSSTISSLTFTSGSGGLSLALFTPATAALTNTSHEIGRAYINSGARTDRMITRGGNFSSSNSPGLFAVDFDSATTGTSSSASFRCVKSL